MEKNYYFNVLTIRKYLYRNICVTATNENKARELLWKFLASKDLLNKDLFYKVELINIQ